MNEIGLSSGTPTFIEEITENKEKLNSSSVCIIGKLVDHNVGMCQGTLIDPSNKQEVRIDTSLIEPFDAKFGSLFHMIGELNSSGSSGDDIVLKTRVVRCVDGIDLTMYRKAVECQRLYLSKRNR